jgi:hypothetical protein
MPEAYEEYYSELQTDVESIIRSMIEYPEDYSEVGEAVRAGIRGSPRFSNNGKRLLTLYHATQDPDTHDYYQPWNQWEDLDNVTAADVLEQMAYSVYYAEVRKEVEQVLEDRREEQEKIADELTEYINSENISANEWSTIVVAGDIETNVTADGEIITEHPPIATEERESIPVYVITPQDFSITGNGSLKITEIDEEYRKSGNAQTEMIDQEHIKATVIVAEPETGITIPPTATNTFEY